MTSEEHVGQQFKKPRILAYRSDKDAVTDCPACHKSAKAKEPDYDWSHYKPVRSDDPDIRTGGIATCSGGCGKTIYNRTGDRG